MSRQGKPSPTRRIAKEPPITTYFLSPEELEKYRNIKPPLPDGPLRTTAIQYRGVGSNTRPRIDKET